MVQKDWMRHNMDFSRFLALRLQVISLLLFFYAKYGLLMKCTDHHKNIFVINPVDTTVKEGENTTFTCAVSNVKDTDRIIWHVNPSRYHSSILNSFNQSTNHMVSKITVYNVGRFSQTYQCVLYVVNSDLTMSSCDSFIAHLDIQYFPMSDELVCGSNGNNPLHNREKIQTWCAVSMGNPRVKLQWVTDKQNGFNQSLKQENGRLNLTLKTEVTPALHKKPITCRAISPAIFPNHQLSCTVGPFVVYHKPKVSVSPAEVTLHVVQNNSIEIICQADAFPPITYFYWACFPPHIIEGCHSSNKSIAITLAGTPAISGNWTKVFAICTAENMMGNSSSSSQITITNIAPPQEETVAQQMIAPWNGSSQRENHEASQAADIINLSGSQDATEVYNTQQFFSEVSLQTSSKKPLIPLSSADMNVVHDSIHVKPNTDDSQFNPKQPHNVYIISVASIVAGILASAGLFAIISVVLYRHFKAVTTQIATQVQCPYEQGSHTMNSLHPEIPLRCEDKNTESSHIYEETRFPKHSEGQYCRAQTMYNSNTLRECSDNSDGSSTSSSYKSSSSLESSQDEGLYSSAIFENRHDMDERKDHYGNQLVIQMQERSSNKIPYAHPNLFDQNCITFPEPPPLPLLK